MVTMNKEERDIRNKRIVEIYQEGKYNCRQIAKMYNMSYQNVYLILQGNNIDRLNHLKPKNKLTEEDKRKCITFNGMLSIEELVKITGKPKHSVDRFYKESGIKKKHVARPKTYGIKDIKDIVDLYAAGNSYYEVADIAGISAMRVHHIVKTHGTPRTRSESAKLMQKKRRGAK